TRPGNRAAAPCSGRPAARWYGRTATATQEVRDDRFHGDVPALGGGGRGPRVQFVPAIFADWAPHLVEAAGVAPGQAVLDVACGTGVVARTAADRMGGPGRGGGGGLHARPA